MKIDFIGHASLLIESTDRKILIDPVFWDPHYEGLCAVSPRRHVFPERLPAYDIIAVSHRHFDHFDIRTLASLDRGCQVLIPDRDPLLAYTFRELGFSRVEALPDNYRWVTGDTAIVTTPSNGPDREFGFLIQDSTATIWNQVDTFVSSRLASRIASRFGPIDFLLATWQPLLESAVFINGRTSFPYEEYFRLLANVQIINPRALAPASCGFKYIDEAAWLNKFVFPVNRDVFVRDAGKAIRGAQVLTANPGDVIEINSGMVQPGAGKCEFVSMVEDDTSETVFNPVGDVPALTDPNHAGYTEAEMLERIEAFVRDQMATAIKQSLQERTIIHDYTKIGCTYQLDIVCPATVVSYSIRFSESEVKLTRDPSPAPNMHTQIAGSILTDVLLGRRSFSYLCSGGFYRSFNHFYAIEEHGCYRWRPTNRQIIDPLLLALDSEELMIKYIDHEISKNVQPAAANTPERISRPAGAAFGFK